jgi:WD40 repeat protein
MQPAPDASDGVHPGRASAPSFVDEVKMRRRSILLLGATGAAGVLTACGGRAETPAATTTAPSASPSPTVPAAERLWQYPLPGNGSAGALAWSPKGDVLAVTGEGQLALLPATMADGGGGQPVVRKAHNQRDVVSVAWSPDGARIATLGEDRTLQFWTAAGEPTHAVTLRTIQYHARVRWSPTGNTAVVSDGTETFLVDVAGATPGAAVSSRDLELVTDLTWAPDGRSYYVLSYDLVIRLPVGDGLPLASLADSAMEVWRAVAVAPDGRVVLAARRKKPVRITEYDVMRIYSADLTAPGPELEIYGFCGIATAIRFSSDARRIAVRFLDGPICVYEITGVEGRLLGAYRGHGRKVEGVDGLAWQPGTDRIASHDADGSIHLWHMPA